MVYRGPNSSFVSQSALSRFAETSAEILKKKMGRKEKERTHNDNAKIYHRWYFISDEFYGRVGFDRASRDMRRKGRDEMLIYTRH